ncbi:MAG: ABC transporter permease [Planctomycetaceae bacterium]|jgi:ABC-2 type transport system permease protein|nr:ABC transporter permease [Planctomycetaceae bacterium]MBT4723509.1 ABC transporter permease [Planctomycetaceae bacterium]MBT4845643.1 ABC transporter permease [Planctomycetaceae bacterium]MBT5124897.1 ABC transporter permease [Planctomycetaceae bacterium]MBT5599870.1 ABC transporter permease [Planctomycetaceae bacterium]
MNKSFVIALREYRAAVRSKAFVITLVAMPVLMIGSIIVQVLLKDKVDTSDKTFAVVDRTGQFEDSFKAAVTLLNQAMVFEGDGDERQKVKPAFILEFIDPESIGEPPESTLKLSDRVRNKEISGFIEIDAGVVDSEVDSNVNYHSQTSVDNAFRRFASEVVNETMQRIRSEKAGIDRAVIQRVMQAVEVKDMSLVERDAETGGISAPQDSNPLVDIVLPMALMMLIFMAVMVGATPLMQAVMEEKQARISEVLLGSIQPFQLMLGKLAGNVAVSLTTVGVYIVGGFCTLQYLDQSHLFPPLDIIIWLLVFQSLAVLMFGALFISIGAAVNDMREAQSAMMPVMIMAMAPMFVWLNVVREPESTFSVAISLFPPATPMLMLLRLAAPGSIPLWQPFLGCGLVILTTILFISAAGKIFRMGILMQGEAASFRRMLSWVIRS